VRWESKIVEGNRLLVHTLCRVGLERDPCLEAKGLNGKEGFGNSRNCPENDVAFHSLLRQVILLERPRFIFSFPETPLLRNFSVTPANCGTVRKLNSVLFPIRYSEKFYKDIVAPEVEDFCKLGQICLVLRICGI